MMSTDEMSAVVSRNVRRDTIVNLKQVHEIPLRNASWTFDKNGDGKIDSSEMQKIAYWYGLWKYASIGLCLIVMTLVWAEMQNPEREAAMDTTFRRRLMFGKDFEGRVEDFDVTEITGAAHNAIHDVAQHAAYAATDKMDEKVDAKLLAAWKKEGFEGHRRRLQFDVNRGFQALKKVGTNPHEKARRAEEAAYSVAHEAQKLKFEGAFDDGLLRRRRLAAPSLNDNDQGYDIDWVAGEITGLTSDPENVRKDLELVFDMNDLLNRRRLGADFDTLKDGFELNPNTWAGHAQSAADYAVQAAGPHTRGDLEEMMKSNGLLSHRRLQVDREKFDSLDKGLKINSVDHGGYAALDASIASQSPEKKRAFEGLIKMPGVHDRRRLQDIDVAGTDFLSIVDMGYAAASEAVENVIEADDAEAQEYEGHFVDLTTPRRRLPLPKFKLNPRNNGGRVGNNAFPAAAQAADAKKQDYEDGLEVLNRRRLQAEFDMNPTDMGYGAAAVDSYAAQAATDAVDPAHMATHDALIRRRLNEVVDTIDSFDFNPNDSGSQVEGSAEAVLVEDDTPVPEHADDWEGFSRRRLSGVTIPHVDLMNTNNMGYGKGMAKAFAAAAKKAALNAVPDLETTNETFNLLNRRRLQGLGGVVDAIGDVDVNLSDFAIQAVDDATDAAIEQAGVAQAVVEQFEDGFPQGERRRLQSGHLNLNNQGYNIQQPFQKPQNSALYTPHEAPNAGPELESDSPRGSYGVDSPRHRFLDESLIQTERRRLPSQEQLGSVGAAAKPGLMTNHINNYVEMPKFNKVDTYMGEGVSGMMKGMLNQVADKFTPSRRRLDGNVVGTVGGTALLNAYGAGYNKKVLQQPAQNAAQIAVPVASGPAGLASVLKNFDEEHGVGRRRLVDFNAFVKAMNGVRKGGAGGTNMDNVTQDQGGSAAASARSQFGVNAIDGAIEIIPADRRRLQDDDALEWFAEAATSGLNDNLQSPTEVSQGSLFSEAQPESSTPSEGFDGEFVSMVDDRRRLSDQPGTNAALGTFAASVTPNINNNPIATSLGTQPNQISTPGSQLGVSAANVMITGDTSMVAGRRRIENESIRGFAGTDFLSSRANMPKTPLLGQPNGQSIAASVPPATAELEKIIGVLNRRRLSAPLEVNIENIDETDILNMMNNGIGEISDDDGEGALAEVMGLLNNDDVEEEIDNENEEFENRRRLMMPTLEDGGIVHRSIGNVGVKLGDSGIKNVISETERKAMADALGKVLEFNDEINSYLEKSKARRRLQGPLNELISASANANESGIGAGLQVALNNAAESENNGTGPGGVEAVVNNF